jgi:hypothetical protein
MVPPTLDDSVVQSPFSPSTSTFSVSGLAGFVCQPAIGSHTQNSPQATSSPMAPAPDSPGQPDSNGDMRPRSNTATRLSEMRMGRSMSTSVRRVASDGETERLRLENERLRQVRLLSVGDWVCWCGQGQGRVRGRVDA